MGLDGIGEEASEGQAAGGVRCKFCSLVFSFIQLEIFWMPLIHY